MQYCVGRGRGEGVNTKENIFSGLMLMLISRKSLKTIIVCNDDRDSHVPVTGYVCERRALLFLSLGIPYLSYILSFFLNKAARHRLRDSKSNMQT